jgi:hypothetical protein
MSDPIRRFDLDGRPRPPAGPAYLNSPVKCCDTCAHQRPADWASTVASAREHAKCARFLEYCSLAVKWPDHCSLDLREWRPVVPTGRPKPPAGAHRSLRQWFHDTFLA